MNEGGHVDSDALRVLCADVPDGCLFIFHKDDVNHTKLHEGFYLMEVWGEFTPSGCLHVFPELDANRAACGVIMKL